MVNFSFWMSVKVAFTILILLLTGCVTQTVQFFVPEKVEFQGQTYVKVAANQLDEMQHLLYLPENGAKNTEQWDKGILFFLDKNTQNQTLDQRVGFRQSSFAKQKDVVAKFSINKQNELQSSVIYPATERFNNVMLEVTRGRNLVCGYGQIQFSDKRTVSNGIAAKKLQDLTTYTEEIMKLAFVFNKIRWQIECR